VHRDVLEIGITYVDGMAIVTVQGEIDMNSAFTLGAALEELHAGAAVLINLASVRFMDSSGLNVLAMHAARLRQTGGSLNICQASTAVQRVVDISGLGELFQPTTLLDTA
jgi:anti-anti-sigma factor